MSQTLELKPCPFCGGNNLRFNLSDIEGWIAHVECTDCDDMLGPMSEYKYDDKADAEEDAAKVWNRRPALLEAGQNFLEGWKLVPKVLTPEMADELNLTGNFSATAMQIRYAAALAKSPAPPALTSALESNPETLRWWCQQLLDIIENYDISHDAPEEELALLNDIRAAVDPASSPSTPS